MEYLKRNLSKIIVLTIMLLVALLGYRSINKPLPIPTNIEAITEVQKIHEAALGTLPMPSLPTVQEPAAPEAVPANLENHNTLPVIAPESTSQSVAKPISSAEIEPIIHNYIMNNPEVLVQSLEQMQRKQFTQKLGEITNHISTSAPTAGNKDGDIKVMAFIDYACGYCKKANQILNQLLKLDPQVHIIFENFPVLGETSEYAAKVMLAVNLINYEKFTAIHEELMNLRHTTPVEVKNLVLAHGITAEQLDDALANPELNIELNRVKEVAAYLGINGTPVFIVNDRFFNGFTTLEMFNQTIKEIRDSQSNQRPMTEKDAGNL